VLGGDDSGQGGEQPRPVLDQRFPNPFFRAEYVLSIRDRGGRFGETSGTTWAFIMSTLDRLLVKARVLWAPASIGTWFWRGGEGHGVFQLRGR